MCIQVGVGGDADLNIHKSGENGLDRICQVYVPHSAPPSPNFTDSGALEPATFGDGQ